MSDLEAKNLYIGKVNIIGFDKNEKQVVVYKKDNYYFDMKYVFSSIDLNTNNKAYYLEKPSHNYVSGLTEQIDINSLENYYTDGRVKFSIYDLHLEIDKDPNLGMIKSSKTR